MWQPIETAPKDNAILLYCPGTYQARKIFMAKWHQPGNASNPGFWAPYDGIKARLANPTHWMPLPEAPNAA